MKTSMTPIENRDAEQAIVALLVAEVRKKTVAEAEAWTTYLGIRADEAPIEAVNAARQEWVIAGAEMNSAFNVALSICEQIGAGWSEIAQARKRAE